MAHPSVSPTRTSATRSRSPTRTSTSNPRKSRSSRSPVPSSARRATLSPLRRSRTTALDNAAPVSPRRLRRSASAAEPSALERATSAPTDDKFLKFCQVHGHEVTEHRHSLLPLNRLSDSSRCHSVGMDGSSSSHSNNTTAKGLAAHLELKQIGSAAAGWLESWTQGGSQHGSERMSYYCQNHPLGPHAKTLQYTQGDILNVAMDDKTFRGLKDGLKKRGVITNNYLRENLHFYVQHIKKVEQKKARRQASRSPLGRNAAA